MYNLFEDYNDYFDTDTAMQLAEDIIDKLSAVHPEWAPNYRFLTISLDGYDSTNCLGNTSFSMTQGGHINIEITVSRYILKNSLIELFKNTFAHEYCHYLVDIDMINDPDVDLYSEEIQFARPELKAFYFANKGHGEAWLKYAAEVSKILGLRFPITPHPRKPESNLYAARNLDEIVVSIACPNGDFHMDLYEKSPKPLFEHDRDSALVLAATMKGDARCPENCGGTLYLEWARQDLEEQYTEELKEIMYRIMLSRLLRVLGL